MDLSAKIMFGYPLPDHEYDDFDVDEIWFEQHGPAEIKHLALSDEENAAWNDLPYGGGAFAPDRRTEEQRRQGEQYREKHSIYFKAKSAWEEENPCPVMVEYCGHGGGDLEYFLTVPKPDGSTYGAEVDWSPKPLNLADLDNAVSPTAARHIQDTLDQFCALAGLDPEGAEAAWYLTPLYW